MSSARRLLSPPTATRERSPRKFYGWRIVAFAAIGLAMTAPGQTVGVSVFVDPMIEGLGLTRSQVSGAYLVGTLLGASTMPVVGRWVDRFGVQIMMLAVGAAFGAALLGMSLVSGALTLAAGFTGIRMLGQGSLSLVSTTSVALWFDRRRGVAIGVCTAVGAAAMSIAPLVLNAAITRFGWQLAWVLAGLVVWFVVVPIARWGMRDSPASVGQRPDGDDRDDGADERARDDGWTRPEALRTLMFWAVTAAVVSMSLIGTGLAFHQISLLGERGLSATQAAANFLPQTAASIAAMLIMGVLIDRMSPRVLIVAAMATLVSAMGLAQVATPGLVAIVYGMALGTTNGAVMTVQGAVFPRYFGVTHIGAIRGLVMAVGVAGSAFGPYVLALGFERFGSYGPVLNALLVLPLAAVVLGALAPVPDRAMRERVRARLTERA